MALAVSEFNAKLLITQNKCIKQTNYTSHPSQSFTLHSFHLQSCRWRTELSSHRDCDVRRKCPSAQWLQDGEETELPQLNKQLETVSFHWADMKTVFVTVGTTSFDELITNITSSEAAQVSEAGSVWCRVNTVTVIVLPLINPKWIHTIILWCNFTHNMC